MTRVYTLVLGFRELWVALKTGQRIVWKDSQR